MSDVKTERRLGTSDFLNPAYREPHWNKEHFDQHYASSVVWRVHALVTTALMAHENETSAVPIESRGIDETLQTARAMLGDLVEEVEDLENRLKRAVKG